jgi:hypothetical protein
MRPFFVIFSVFVFFLLPPLQSQTDCEFKADTVYIPKFNKVINGEVLQTAFKNRSILQLIKGEANTFFLKLIVTENLYFNKVDQLEIKSGTKSFYAKETKHYELDKNTGFYVIEIWKNYIATLKDDGITAITFGSATTEFTKQDATNAKQIAKCFYEKISAKNTNKKFQNK